MCDGKTLQTSPIKGTCPQGSNPEEASRLRETMIGDQKERAEHRMLVDLMRNDLTRVARPGTINVDRFDVEAYANVQHLVSHISAHLDDRETGLQRCRRCFQEVPSPDALARWCARSSTSWKKCPVPSGRVPLGTLTCIQGGRHGTSSFARLRRTVLGTDGMHRSVLAAALPLLRNRRTR